MEFPSFTLNFSIPRATSYSVKSQATVILYFLSTLKNIQMAKIGITILTNTHEVKLRSLLNVISLIHAIIR